MRENRYNWNREYLYKMKGTICANCGQDKKEQIEYHHIIPIILGGQDVLTNIIPLCHNCHDLIHHNKDSNINTGYLVKISQALKEANLTITKKKKVRKIGRPALTYNDLTDEIKQIIIKIQNKEIYKKDAAIKLNISRPTLDKYIQIFNSKEH